MTNRTDCTTWILCERYAFPDGTFATWGVVDGVSPASSRSHLESFERPANGEQVSERRAFRAVVQVET